MTKGLALEPSDRRRATAPASSPRGCRRSFILDGASAARMPRRLNLTLVRLAERKPLCAEEQGFVGAQVYWFGQTSLWVWSLRDSIGVLMGFDAHVLKVLIASPGDTTRERDAIEKALHGWNSARAEREQIQLAPWRWETHAIPELGGTAQDIIDRQAVETCDVVIAVFNARLGTATDDAVSGTAHEIVHAHRAGKPVHVYFSTEPFPRDTKPDELERLNAFQEQLRKEGLLGEYSGTEDLQFKVRDAIEHDLRNMDLGKVVIRSNKADQARKVMSYRTSVSVLGDGVWRVQVFNHSTGPITRLKVDVSAVDAKRSPVDGVRRSKDVISMDEVFSRIVGDGLAGGFGRLIGQGPARMLGNTVAAQARPAFNDALVGHVADGYPSGLAPNEAAVVLYVLPTGATPIAVVEFHDEAGVEWSRTNDDEPKRI